MTRLRRRCLLCLTIIPTDELETYYHYPLRSTLIALLVPPISRQLESVIQKIDLLERQVKECEEPKLPYAEQTIAILPSLGRPKLRSGVDRLVMNLERDTLLS